MRIDAEHLKKFWVQETPSGTVNGSNTAFTISQTPVEGEAVMVFLNGLLQKRTTDWTLSGTTITFTVAPATSSTLDVFFIMKSGEN